MVAKNLFFFSLIFWGASCFSACRLEQEMVSLSGPMTMLLEEMDLIKDPKLLAISKFHPVKNAHGKTRLAGGLFLSPKIFHQYSKSLIVFDKSREFKYLLKKSQHNLSLEIDSRDQDPFEVMNYLLLKLREMTKGCRQNIKKMQKLSQQIKEQIVKQAIPLKAVFFLGSIQTRLPEIVMNNDGFVMFLRRKQLVESYPSPLAYVNWSQKELGRLNNYLFVGLGTAGTDKLEIQKKGERRYNLLFRGLLIPGIRQIKFLQQYARLSSTF